MWRLAWRLAPRHTKTQHKRRQHGTAGVVWCGVAACSMHCRARHRRHKQSDGLTEWDREAIGMLQFSLSLSLWSKFSCWLESTRLCCSNNARHAAYQLATCRCRVHNKATLAQFTMRPNTLTANHHSYTHSEPGDPGAVK